MNNTTKICVLAEASRPDKNYCYDGDYVKYKGKLYWVELATERVTFIRNLEEGENE